MTHRIPQFHPFLHAAQLITDRLRLDLAGLGGTSVQGRVLDVIARLESPSPARVGEALGLTASAMSQMVQRLRKARLIEESRKTKGRAYSENLVLSQDGEEFLRQTREVWTRMEQELVGLIGKDALTAMFHTSYDIVQGLGENPPFPRHLHLPVSEDDSVEPRELEFRNPQA